MVDGFLVIDKPAGISSHDVVNRVRRILGTRKVGHTGTLDPFATGVLPIAVGEGTKAIQFLDEGEKAYEAVIRLGLVTDTLDITGTVLQEHDSGGLGQEQLLSAMEALTGEISQVPPMYSAIKQGGQPLYKLARKGIEVERQSRQVIIHSFELLEFSSPLATVRAHCSRGTYVRTLADDLGKLLGCGACLTALRRTLSGPFRLADAMTLEQLASYAEEGVAQHHVVHVPTALSHLAQIQLTESELQKLKNGIPPRDRLLEMPPGMFSLMYGQQVIAVAEQTPEKAVSLKRVFN
ncbi:tRNA pseudouridine(55) synthase TruB [Trichlorobacter lovleyi]|uniref:tRNA pseudouridine synthase B n=1 Tax=Trichlorobacter lovleyi (strain ATCC BAA-1151 / DSM 17278 / SZ) TaxID=398767 RepID=B3EAF0_TRIL1|nr:tRNA pseudouridine(55) synthase TruB [Trichlorobacter lovleyi]ACD95388.1 tRNA pseudouridine synthase B [Trichlorobacter lovleyi SZ]